LRNPLPINCEQTKTTLIFEVRDCCITLKKMDLARELRLQQA
jgi:hypothetical protein